MVECLRPGGRLALSAFSAYFQVRYLEDGDDFDADRGVNHERTEVRDPAGHAPAGRAVDVVLHAQGAAAAGPPGRCSTSTASGR